MGLFLTLYFIIYGGMNVCFFVHARRAFGLQTAGTCGLGFVLTLMVFAPFLIRLLTESGYVSIGSKTALISFTWMGLVFSFFVAILVSYFLMIIIAPFTWWKGVGISFAQWTRPLFWIPCLYMGVVFFVGLFQADQIQLEEFQVSLKRPIPGFPPIRLVHLSDLHIGLTSIDDRIHRVAEMAKAAQPDLLVVTGDLLDGPILREEEMAGLFRSIDAPLGKFFVLGNHEFYEGIEHAERFAAQAGLKLLRNEVVQINAHLEIVGIDDPGLQERNGEKAPSDLSVLPPLSANRVRLFLKHRPVIDRRALDRFDIQLSGHSHAGQIFPFTIFTNLFASHPCGMHDLGQAWFYHHRGSATWGPPLRFLTTPEVALLQFSCVSSETAPLAAN